MPRLLLLLPVTTYRADAFLEAAGHLNLAVTIGTDAAGWPGPRRPPDHLELDFNNHDRAVRSVQEYHAVRRIDAVIGVDDTTAVLAAAVSHALGLPHNPPAAVSAARNKQTMREALHTAHVTVPAFQVFPLDADPTVVSAHVPYPCVVKPLILSASCGVIRANDEKGFATAFRRVEALLDRMGLTTGDQEEAGRKLLVEEFIPGREVALEGLLTAGDLHMLALFDKPDPLDGPYFEETLYVTPSGLPKAVQSTIVATTSRAAAALGLREGPIHGELRVNDRGVWVIELAARSIGGRCSRTLRFAADRSPDMSLEELILRHALRMPLPALAPRTGAAGVMMLPIPRGGVLQEIRGEEAARAVGGIEELTMTASIGQELVPLPEGTRYLGFIIARGKTPEAVEEALREAHRRLEFVIGAALPELARSCQRLVF
jgi:formate-dependent phosphoribosylglycinamide formyltransferase (GAR transformylase)